MRVNEYRVLADAVENGVTRGVNRAYKHNDNPDGPAFVDNIVINVLSEICEYFRFDFQEEDEI